jgi:hypothetical protein
MERIRQRLAFDLKTAMKKRNTSAVKTIRNLISAIDNAGAVPMEAPREMLMFGGIAGAREGLGSAEVPRKQLLKSDIDEIIRKEIAELEQAMEMAGMQPAAEQYLEQIHLLKQYLQPE